MKKKKLTAAQQRARFIDNLRLIKDCLKQSGSDYVWGVDISLTNTGLTIYNIKDKSFFSVSHKKFKGSRYQRINQLHEAFLEHVSINTPKLVIIEGYAYGSKQMREVIGETSYAVKSVFVFVGENVSVNIPCIIVPPTSLKKFVAGRGNKVEKKEIQRIVSEEWGAEIANGDEADSYVLCVIGLNILFLARSFKSKRKYTDKDIQNLIKKNFNMGTSISKQQFEILYRVIVDDGNDVGRFFA